MWSSWARQRGPQPPAAAGLTWRHATDEESTYEPSTTEEAEDDGRHTRDGSAVNTSPLLSTDDGESAVEIRSRRRDWARRHSLQDSGADASAEASAIEDTATPTEAALDEALPHMRRPERRPGAAEGNRQRSSRASPFDDWAGSLVGVLQRVFGDGAVPSGRGPESATVGNRTVGNRTLGETRRRTHAPVRGSVADGSGVAAASALALAAPDDAGAGEHAGDDEDDALAEDAPAVDEPQASVDEPQAFQASV